MSKKRRRPLNKKELQQLDEKTAAQMKLREVCMEQRLNSAIIVIYGGYKSTLYQN